jgi:hypothetical protein
MPFQNPPSKTPQAYVNMEVKLAITLITEFISKTKRSIPFTLLISLCPLFFPFEAFKRP